MNDDVQCPYCGVGNEICTDDGCGMDESKLEFQECRNCEKVFSFSTSIIFVYNAEKADCQNGADHHYKITSTSPREFSRMRCTMCDKERPLTDDERTLHGIKTEKEYFQELEVKHGK